MPKVSYSNLATSGDFIAAGKSLSKRSASLKNDFQASLVCALNFTATHGDYESSLLVILDAAKGLGKNLHRAMEEWILAYSWLAADEASKSGFRKDQTKKMDIDGGKANMWWETEKPPVGKPFDLQKAIQTLFDKVMSEAEAGRLNIDDAVSTIASKAWEAKPDLFYDMFDAMADNARTEALGVLVARMTPADEVQSENLAAAA